MTLCNQYFNSIDGNGDPMPIDIFFFLHEKINGEWVYVVTYRIPANSTLGINISIDSETSYKAEPASVDGWKIPSDVIFTGCFKNVVLKYLEIVCTHGVSECVGNDVYKCSSDGTRLSFVESCPAGCTNGVCDEVLSLDALTCKGFQEDCEPFRVEEIFGKTLYMEDLYPDICDWFTYACDFNCGFRSWSPTTSFDLSSLTRNEHEVGVTYVTMGGLATNGRYHVLAKWYDPNNDHLFTNNSGYFTGVSSKKWICWIGYCDWEISINGEYKVIVELFEDDRLIMVDTIYFGITGISCPSPTCSFGVI